MPKPEVKIKVYTYTWEGTNKQGHRVQGELTSSNLALAKTELRRQGITPLKVRKKPAPLFQMPQKIKSKDITVFTRQVATMLTSGIPIIQAFDLISRGQSKVVMQNLVTQIKTEIEGGSPLHEALSHHPEHFNDLYCNLVAAGEQSGSLDNMLSRLAIYKEKTESIKGKIKKALYYPVAVLSVLFVVTIILLVFVVPQFESMFKSFGADLPALTKFVVALSRFFQAYWWLFAGGLVAFIVGVVKAQKRYEAVAYFMDRLSLRLPVIGVILRKAIMARYARTLSITFAAGLPLVDSLKTTAGAAGNRLYRDAILKIREDVSTGQQLQLAMQFTHLFPPMVIQMVAIGEESGTLERMLGKIADFFEEEVDNAVDSLSSLLEPIIIVILGGVVGTLVVAMYLPIFKMGSVIK